jgi:hypothetical protein
MYEPNEPTVQSQLPTYEYKAVAFTGSPATSDELQALLNPEGADGWLMVGMGGSFFIMARQTNSNINPALLKEVPTPPFYYGR